MAWIVTVFAVGLGVLALVWWGTVGSRRESRRTRSQRFLAVYLALWALWIAVGAFQAIVLSQVSLGAFAMGEGVVAVLVGVWLLRRQLQRIGRQTPEDVGRQG